MNWQQRKLRRQQLDAQLSGLDVLRHSPTPQGGWIRAVRVSLGMSLEQFARRLRLASGSTAFQLEKGECEGTITLNRMRAAADALGCDVVIGLVPRQPLEHFVQDQARRKATEKLGRVSHTMDLEFQGVDHAGLNSLHDQTVDDLLRKGGRDLWG